ncbi:hypothetical protein A8U91_04711 [Halomonas elongata]|uniref:Uncharacterized protein n=1 Tax=Halomonas elongata TaxID=2746 RepID=A0A1B8P043_HALEL|nr:hypothetical protein [Halomonas elongata]OBX35637.1 hypothetical protein A8U91_04711 [Halomonas elongata]
MMTTPQKRALRKVCREGGTLTLTTDTVPLTVEVTLRKRANYPDRADAKISESPKRFLKFNDWPLRELYAELNERLDEELAQPGGAA